MISDANWFPNVSLFNALRDLTSAMAWMWCLITRFGFPNRDTSACLAIG
ncbi:hypothetical protein T08_6395 [Trichinella sp. T8]|nr:hypothetical protein T08_6395 [Trichinella sp. T8]